MRPEICDVKIGNRIYGICGNRCRIQYYHQSQASEYVKLAGIHFWGGSWIMYVRARGAWSRYPLNRGYTKTSGTFGKKLLAKLDARRDDHLIFFRGYRGYSLQFSPGHYFLLRYMRMGLSHYLAYTSYPGITLWLLDSWCPVPGPGPNKSE